MLLGSYTDTIKGDGIQHVLARKCGLLMYVEWKLVQILLTCKYIISHVVCLFLLKFKLMFINVHFSFFLQNTH